MSAVVVTTESATGQARRPLDPGVLDGGMAGLLSAVTDGLGLEGAERVVDVALPRGSGRAPGLGIEGIRRRLGVYGRPLTLMDLGRFPEETAGELGARVRRGVEDGIDIFHDAVTGSEAGVFERLAEVRQALEDVERLEGRRLLYAVRVAGRPDKLLERARALIAAGANALVYDALSLGLGGLEALVADEDVQVPILAATNGVASLCGAPGHGLAWRVVLGTLVGRAGPDMVLYPGPATGGPIDPAEDAEVRRALCRLGIFPAPVTGPACRQPVRGWAEGADVVLPAPADEHEAQAARVGVAS